jgi:hypothetical protein
LIISGTGRAETTFLMQLFTKLGLDTGFSSPNEGLFANCNAGMENDIHRPDAPYIIMSPWLCDRLDELCESGQVVVDHVIIPIRDLHAAAQSRIEVERATPPEARVQGWPVPGRLWVAREPQSQTSVLAEELARIEARLESPALESRKLFKKQFGFP